MNMPGKCFVSGCALGHSYPGFCCVSPRNNCLVTYCHPFASDEPSGAGGQKYLIYIYFFFDATNLIRRVMVQLGSGFLPEERLCYEALFIDALVLSVTLPLTYGITRQFIQKLLVIANEGLVFTLEARQTTSMTLNNASFFDLQNNMWLTCFLEQRVWHSGKSIILR